ncbi:MAG: hypothetical protein KGI78_02595 [Patescibacteria group bacterium]|nr:hypothetical protein [Patescibacteria group bacterium]MDE1945516.1 hypothetical protein [Patescibacteria group bacterium]MDE2057721.1 hypothetical protein [Patescibacteria group bacterium]
MKKPSSNTLFLIIASLVVAGGVYWYFFTGSPSAPLTAGAGGESATQAKFDTLTQELSPISFNLSVLSDPRFTALIDIATPVAPEPVGRTDPFAPIPGVSDTATGGAATK